MESGQAKSNGQPENWERISPQYREMQERLHEKGYGVMGSQYGDLISQIINTMEVTHLLDYGCGSNLSLVEGLKGKVKHKLTYQAYDPCVPRFAKQPLPAQMVCCIDVLEHIEPWHLEGVLDDLVTLTEGIVFLSIFTKAAVKVLDDGRNAHLIQEPIQWWLPKLWDRWDLHTVQSNMNDGGYFFIGYAKTKLEDASGAKLT